ncbi:MAG TPA: hypothetical protein DIW53_20410, partial [Achromobacter sp.]|nr:hypothetical protein [Achromobacter sp.]
AETLAQISDRKKEVQAILKDVIQNMKEEIDVKSSTFVRTGGNSTASNRSTWTTCSRQLKSSFPTIGPSPHR